MDLVTLLDGAFLIGLEDSAAIHYRGNDVYAVVDGADLQLISDRGNDVPIAVARSIEAWTERIWYYRSCFFSIPIAVEEEYGEEAPKVCSRLIRKRFDAIPSIRDLVAAELSDEPALTSPRRQVIPDEVKMFVWKRDEGRCVKCGTNEKLEFDHIIPVAMGGSDTARNLQLLCESCNRRKGSSL